MTVAVNLLSVQLVGRLNVRLCLLMRTFKEIFDCMH